MVKPKERRKNESSMGKKLNWGIIGTGNIAAKFAEGLSCLGEEACLYAVGSRELQKAEAFAAPRGIPHACGSYEELVKDPEIDVVYIGVPHTFHRACAELAIKAGKHVLCEKPMCVNRKEAEKLQEAARKEGVFLMEAMWTKFLPVIQEVKKLLDAGAVGEILGIEASFGFWNPFDGKARLYNKQLGGGALLDVGIYPLNLACFLMGKLPVKTESQAVLGETGVDEINAMLLTFEQENGKKVLAELRSACRASQGCNAWIYGTKGKIWIPSFFNADKAVVECYEDGTTREIVKAHQANGYEYEAMAVDACIREGKTECAVHTWKDTLDMLELMDKMRNEWGVRYEDDEKL